MSLKSLKPFIPSGPDFGQARSFFLDLGFVVNWEIEGLAELQLGAAAFLLQDLDNPEMQSHLMMYVEVESLDDWWAHLTQSGVLGKYDGVRAKDGEKLTIEFAGTVA